MLLPILGNSGYLITRTYIPYAREWHVCNHHIYMARDLVLVDNLVQFPCQILDNRLTGIGPASLPNIMVLYLKHPFLGDTLSFLGRTYVRGMIWCLCPCGFSATVRSRAKLYEVTPDAVSFLQ